MFTQDEAANLIYRTIDYTRKHEGGFVCSYKMKCVNMFDLAKVISDNIEIVGKRPGEKRDEDLISKHELPYTYVRGNDIHIRAEENIYDKKLEVPYNSQSAEKMTSKQIKELVEWN